MKKNPNFPPFDGVAYKVHNGDNFEVLAQYSGMPAQAILQYNYGATDSRYVNWYLRNHVGVTKQSDNQISYSFTNAADPGIVYFPVAAWRNLQKNHPDLDLVDGWQVPSPVPQLEQGYLTPLCWAYSGIAMKIWKYGGPPDVRAHLAGLPSSATWLKAFDAKDGISEANTRKFYKEIGITGTPSVPGSKSIWDLMPRNRGPVLIIKESDPGYVHWIVVFKYLEMSAPDGSKWVQLTAMDPGGKAPDSFSMDSLVFSSRRTDFYYKVYVWV